MNTKAIVVKGPWDFSWEERPVTPPGPGEVLVKIEAAGLCGTDIDILSNEMEFYTSGLAKLPIVPGHEWAGTVEQLGEGVDSFSVGDTVTGECTVSCGDCKYCIAGRPNLCTNRTETGVMNRDGGYSGYITFPVRSLHRFHNLTFDEAAAIEPACIAAQAVIRGRVQPMDNVLVMGPGPIGLLAAQFAKKVYGAKRVLLSGTRDERLVRAQDYTDGVINIRSESLADRVAALTDGEGVDVVLEAAGAESAFADCENILSPGGRIVLCGFFGTKSAPCRWDFISTHDMEILGSLGSPGIWGFVISMIEQGKIDIGNIISHRLRLGSKEDFVQAVAIMTERRENVCKIILHP